jgi:hypothetical protein
MSMRSGRTLSSLDSSILSDVWREEVQEVEMLLESYFMHIDNIYNRLKVRVDGMGMMWRGWEGQGGERGAAGRGREG